VHIATAKRMKADGHRQGHRQVPRGQPGDLLQGLRRRCSLAAYLPLEADQLRTVAPHVTYQICC
jgi:hypothetical protein